MGSNNKIYEQLNYSDKEIGAGMLIPADLSEEERKKAKEELLAFRFQLLEN